MKYQKILGLVATAGLFLAGCATDTDTQNAWFNDSNAVRISASVGNATTRSNPTATDDAGLKSFNSGDKIGISNSGSSLTYTFDGTNWTPGNSEYLVWDTKNLTFQCWYPADGKNSFEYGYIQEDQSDADKIVKSDYMAAETTPETIPSDKVLTVQLKRKTARLILRYSILTTSLLLVQRSTTSVLLARQLLMSARQLLSISLLCRLVRVQLVQPILLWLLQEVSRQTSRYLMEEQSLTLLLSRLEA